MAPQEVSDSPREVTPIGASRRPSAALGPVSDIHRTEAGDDEGRFGGVQARCVLSRKPEFYLFLSKIFWLFHLKFKRKKVDCTH
jgi:hypothetical protein